MHHSFAHLNDSIYHMHRNFFFTHLFQFSIAMQPSTPKHSGLNKNEFIISVNSMDCLGSAVWFFRSMW